jgi:dipeptidyl aminopeptidase/acylaminoacyl peptidase
MWLSALRPRPSASVIPTVGRNLLLLVTLSGTLAAQGPPSTDIWLASLERRGDSLIVGTPRNITNRAGYDNQPSFTPDSKAILFTSVREDGQADIYRFDIASGTTTRATSTPESEYSATVTPDGRFFSVIRVERDSTQRLWKFPLAGGAPSLVLENVKPVGYHAWVDDTTLALFVLGRPATLQVATTTLGTSRVLASNIGRSLASVPDPRGRYFSYIQRDSVKGDEMFGYLPSSSACLPFPIAKMAGNEFHAWLGHSVALSTRADTLVQYAPFIRSTSEGPGIRCVTGLHAEWKMAASLTSTGARRVSRLAASPDGSWIAFVAEPVAPPVRKDP